MAGEREYIFVIDDDKVDLVREYMASNGVIAQRIGTNHVYIINILPQDVHIYERLPGVTSFIENCCVATIQNIGDSTQ